MEILRAYYSPILFAVVFLLHILAIEIKSKVLQPVTKICLMPLLILLYFNLSYSIDFRIVTGLFFAFWGDAFLIFQKRRAFFIGGILAFTLTHVFYILAFTGTPKFLTQVPVHYWLIAIPYIIYGIVVLKLLLPRAGKLKVPVFIYTVIILVMDLSSWLRAINHSGYSFWCPVIGGLLFVLSDTILALNKFNKQVKKATLYIALTYVTAQFLIVLGFT
ncbi:lysoplasmalogenase [bacterium]|nr:lysoplasmalogenase [bacterium]